MPTDTMELRHIRYFLEVAETLNFSRAAERLHVAQPALSKQIRDLEEELGGRLFDRTTTKVALTEMGHYFRQQTRKLVFQLDIAVTAAQQLAQGARRTLKLGCDWRATWLPVGVAARRLREMNSKLSVQFVELPGHEHVAAVRARAIDIGFVPSIFLGDTEDLDLRNLFALKLKVILPAGHPLAGRSTLSLRDLKNERWLAIDSGAIPGFRVIMSQILDYNPKYGLTTTAMPGLLAHVSAGHGIGLIPESDLGLNHDGVVSVDTDCTPIPVFAISQKDTGSPLVPAFLDIVDELITRTRRRGARG